MSPLAFGQYVLDVPERTVDTTGQDFDVHVGECARDQKLRQLAAWIASQEKKEHRHVEC